MEELYEARKDFLTNCYTRDSLNPFLSRMEAKYLERKSPFSIFIIDVDRFKTLNDKYGHLCGDEVLKYFSSSIRLDLEEEVNAPFRFGGDEFVVVFPGKTARETHKLAYRLRKNIKSRPCLYKGRNIQMAFSGGIACYPEDARNIEELLEKADEALYASKKKGRSRVMMYTQLKTERLIRYSALAAAALVVLLAAVTYKGSPLERGVAGVVEAVSKAGLSVRKNVRPAVVRSAPAEKTAASPVLPAKAAAPRAEEEPPPADVVDIIYFKSGGALKGRIVGENEDTLQIQPRLTTGKGLLAIKKSEVSRIERGVPA